MRTVSSAWVSVGRNPVLSTMAGILLTISSAGATPLALAPGGTGAIPIYSASEGSPKGASFGAACGFFNGTPCATDVADEETTAFLIAGGSNGGGIMEVANGTGINPYGASDVAFGLFVGGPAAANVTSVTISGLAGYSTAVEACSPTNLTCSPNAAGIAARSANGDSITFSDLPAVQTEPCPVTACTTATYSDIYFIYTNAPSSALIDPENLVVMFADGSSSGYDGLGLTAASVPEPATLSLFGLGLAGIGFLRRRKKNQAIPRE